MKLNLYMIANKLKYVNPILHIFETDKQTYRNCRNVRREGYIYIKENDDGVYIYGQYPDSYILLKDSDEKSVYNAVLDIFDYYNENEEKIIQAVEKNEYQVVIDICYDLFSAPCFILSRNNKVIAISSKPGADELNNPEWKHLHEYGYSSISNFTKFKDVLQMQESLFDNRTIYYKSPPTQDRTGFMISMLCNDKNIYGRITAMEYFRKFNEGDFYLMELVSKIVSNHMHIAAKDQSTGINGDILIDLLSDNKVEYADIENVMKYYKWNENDTFRLVVISGSLNDDEFKLAKEYIDNSFMGCLSAINDGKIVLLLSEKKYNFPVVMEMFKNSYIAKLELKYGISLEFDDLIELSYYYKQALYAISQNLRLRKNAEFAYFYDYALDFILSDKSFKEKMSALNPDVVKCMKKSGRADCESLNTLYTYLSQERSLLKASEELCIHRNTLLYRINKLSDDMSYDLNDPYTREYMLISIRYLISNNV